MKHCIQQPNEVCYDNAKNLLIKRYGDPHKILSAISKLPMSVGDRWSRRVQFTRKNQLREPDLADFIKFVDEETELVNDPLYYKRDRRFKTLAVQLEKDSKEKNLAKNTKNVVPCVMCAKIHDLEQCKAYLTKSVDERSKYLSNKKLCYGCLKPISKTHTARNCNQRRTCKVCNEKHPTSLQGFKLKKKTKQGAVNDTPDQSETLQEGVLKSNVTICDKNIVCTSTKNNAQVISMCVVPVSIKHKDSAKDIITHAILDSCSQGTFTVEELVNALEIDGIDTTVVVKTLNGQTRLKLKLIN